MTRQIRTTNKGIFVTGGEPEPAASEEVVVPEEEKHPVYPDVKIKQLLKPATVPKLPPTKRPDDVEPLHYGSLDQDS